MARNKSPNISSTDLSRYLSTQDDFALELAVFNDARRLGYRALHGGTYQDPITGKVRQFDVRASISSERFHLEIAIECKSLRESFPLLVSHTPRTRAEAYHEIVLSSKPVDNDVLMAYHVNRPPAHIARPVGADSIYPEDEPVGKATVQVAVDEKGEFRSSDSETHDKWSQAVSSCNDAIKGAASRYRREKQDAAATVILPVLVVSDNTLWAADYSSDGALNGDPVARSRTTLYLGRQCASLERFSYTISHLHLCTKSAVKELLHDLSPSGRLWDRLFSGPSIRRVTTGTS